MKILDYSSIYKISINNTGEVKMFKLNLKHVVSFLSLSLFMFLAIGTGGDADAEVESDIADAKPEFTISASKLASAFDENEIQANKDYKEKVFIVEGSVQSISETLGSMYVVLNGGKSFGTDIQCFFSENQTDEIAKLKKGTSVKIKGKCNGKSMNVSMKGCTIVK